MSNELTVNLQIDASSECLKRLCDGLAAAVKPDGGYAAATTDDPAPGTGCDQMVQVEWWIPQHGCDSLENTLDAIKGRLAVAVRDWWSTALVPAAPPAPEVGEVGELVKWLEEESGAYRQTCGSNLASTNLTRAATLLQQLSAPAPVVVPVAWCRSDEFAKAMKPCGGSFNGWKDPGAGVNKCDMQLYAIPLPQGGEGEG